MLHLEKFIVSLEVERGYSNNTITAYKTDIAQFFDKVNKKESLVVRDDVLKYISLLNKEGYTSKSISRKLTAVKEYYKYLTVISDGKINNPTVLIKSPKLPTKVPVYLEESEIEQMMELTKDNPRKHLIISLLYYTGLRVSELCNLRAKDVSESSLNVLGKGNKQRVLPTPTKLKDAISSLKKTLREDDYLFRSHISSKKGITRDGVYKLIQEVGSKCGINKEKLHPHALRHSTATSMLNKGVDIRVIQEVLGHSNLSTTAIYASVSMNNKINAINVL
jgi:integrase/recombinase XerD